MKKIVYILLLIFSFNAYATDVTIPTVYQTNGSVTAVNLNGNFTAVAQKINGGLDNENVDTTNGYRLFEIRSSLPSAGTQGRVVFLTTNNSLNFDTGSAWVAVGTSGVLVPSGGVFFMASGACPTGTTDISSAYSNKYVKINSTQLTSAGVVLTGATDSHVLTTSEVPALTVSLSPNVIRSAGGDGPNLGSSANGGSTYSLTATTNGSGGGHTHTLSTASTLEPSSITMRACRVD